MFFIGRCRVRNLFLALFYENSSHDTKKALLKKHGHNPDTLFLAFSERMRPPSIPKISKKNPSSWYIYWSHDVPVDLWPYYTRKRERIKKYDNINRYQGAERETYAEERRKIWETKLRYSNYNPFLKELDLVRQVNNKVEQIDMEVEDIQAEMAAKPLYQSNMLETLKTYCESKVATSTSRGAKSNWRSFYNIYAEYFNEAGLGSLTTGGITHKILVNALEKVKIKREWTNTSFNNNRNTWMMFINWLVREEHIAENPSKGKITKQKQTHTIHTWYDRETAKLVKEKLSELGLTSVKRACQFTYWLCIRSQQELLKLRAGDIDRNLKRVRFRNDLSKNRREAFRDYKPEFDLILDSMDFDNIPKHYLLFSKSGLPGAKPAGKNTLSNLFKPVKDALGLSVDYTIYGFKHTRVVHEMMKGTDPYEIQHLCRHANLQETIKYMRDFDITLKNVYDAEDLTF